MTSGTDPSERLTRRDVPRRLVVSQPYCLRGMPRLAEAYAAECEDRARCFDRLRQRTMPRVVDPAFESAAKITARRAA